jgi:hypothetical protein
MSDADLICPKCKTTYLSTTKVTYCVCGGKLEKKFTMRDVEEIFPWMRKDKKFTMRDVEEIFPRMRKR